MSKSKKLKYFQHANSGQNAVTNEIIYSPKNVQIFKALVGYTYSNNLREIKKKSFFDEIMSDSESLSDSTSYTTSSFSDTSNGTESFPRIDHADLVRERNQNKTKNSPQENGQT